MCVYVHVCVCTRVHIYVCVCVYVQSEPLNRTKVSIRVGMVAAAGRQERVANCTSLT